MLAAVMPSGTTSDIIATCQPTVITTRLGMYSSRAGLKRISITCTHFGPEQGAIIYEQPDVLCAISLRATDELCTLFSRDTQTEIDKHIGCKFGFETSNCKQ